MFTIRGNPSTITTQGKTTTVTYDTTGTAVRATDGAGNSVNLNTTSATNFAVPSSVQPPAGNGGVSLTSSFTWNQFLGLTQAAGPNLETAGLVYDTYARETTRNSPYGAQTTIAYTNPTIAHPEILATKTETTNGRWVRTTFDGFARPVKVETGDATSTMSRVDTVYVPCACSAIGKVGQVSQPYAPGGSVYWTVNAYDALGRTVSVTQPGNDGTRTYTYAGNTVTATDEAGKWKKFTVDVFGNLTQVNEPNPGSNDYVTQYTYTIYDKLATVTMPRATGTQTRSFAYDTQLRLQSATHPETGTTSYEYDPAGRVSAKTDAKGQRVAYVYDANGRVTQVNRFTAPYIAGLSQPDGCQSPTYTYDATPPGAIPGWGPQYMAGRLTGVSWGQVDNCTALGNPGQFAEMYSYVQAGGVATKRMQVTRPLAGGTQGQQTTAKLDAVFQYDNEGKMTSMKTPDYWITGNPNQQTGETFNYTYDTMARLTGLTQSGVSQALVNSIVYGGANQITQLNYGDGTIQTRTYNARLQVTRMTSGSDLDVEYQYSGTTNNGQIAMRWDHLSGEQVTYQYDSLKRLTAAGTTTGAAPWSQTYGYDGFGNRTSLNGAATGYDPATNRMLSASYDGNGNTTSMAGFVANGLIYDIDNRLVSASPTSGGLEQYGYNHNNQRVWRKKAGGTEEFYFYNLNGQRLGVFTGATGDGSGNFFFGRVSLDSVIPKGLQRKRDRLGSTFEGGTTRYFPYGEENPATSTNDRDKFATYQRDSTTGLDYAEQRYYASVQGRFLTPDPTMDNVDHSNPGSWNGYAYAIGDPINLFDPDGTTTCGDLQLSSNRTVGNAALANTDQGHFIDLVWHEAGFLSQAGGNVGVWTAEFALIAQAIWDRYLLVQGAAQVTGANGVTYGGANVGVLGYGAYGSSLNQVLLHAAAGTNVLNSSGQLVDNAGTLRAFLNQDQGNFQYAAGRLALVNGAGDTIWVTQGCYSVIAAIQSADGVAAGYNFNPSGRFITSWNSSAPNNNPNYAAGVEQLLITAGPSNFYGFSSYSFGNFPGPPRARPPVQPGPPTRPGGPRAAQ